MKNNGINPKIFGIDIYYVLKDCVGSDYAHHLIYGHDRYSHTNDFFEAVKQDVEETSAWEYEGWYTEDDIRLAIGRVLLDKFAIPY